MFQCSIVFAVVLASACGGEAPTPSDSQTPFANLPPSTGSSGGGGGSLGGGAGGGTPGSGDGGMPITNENIAEKIWNAQADLSKSGSHFSSTYGANAFSWLREAKTAAGAQVTSGTITVLANGSTRYVAGGSTLKLSKPGYSGELRVDSLTGDILSSDFPRAGDSIDVTWLFANGKAARCVLKHDETQFEGTFVDEHGDEAEVRVSWFRTSDGDNYPDSSGVYVFFAHGTVNSTGEHIYSDGRRVTYTMHEDYSTCVTRGAGCFVALSDHRYTHDVSLRLGNSTWNLKYVTGWKQQTNASTIAKYWRGTISGPTSGTFVVRPVGPVFGLDVKIGADAFNADSALAIAQ